MLIPTIADSKISVSTTLSSPNSSYRPCVAPKAPPYGPTSSPRTNTFGSRRISSASASRIASRYESSRIQVGHRFGRIRVRRIHRELYGAVDRLLHLRLDIGQFVVGEDVHPFQVGCKGRNGIAALPHRQLFVSAVERLVVLRVAVPAVGLALDQRRPVAGTSAGERTLRRLIDREHIDAIDRDAVESVALGA